MKLFLVIVAVIATVWGEIEETRNEPVSVNYHEDYGIPEAARIKASESAPDFGNSRITGGSRAKLGQFPFMAGLVITVPQGQSVCGSTLISNTRVVTAAHCWTDGRTQAIEFTVVLGSTTLFSGGTRINTNQVVVHPNYNRRRISDDVAVIRIPHVEYTANIRAIDLASGSDTFEGSTATAIGFGAKGDDVGITHRQSLSFVRLQVITNADCRRTYDIVISSTLCTSGAERRNICGGDSGGPLVIDNTLIGITSFGAAVGCTRGHPGGFARVTSFNSWIRAQ